MDKYIKREDLGEALKAIARCAMENAGKIRTEITIEKGWKGSVELKVTVRDEQSFNTLAEDTFMVVSAVKPAEYCDAILAAIDLRETKAEAEVEPEAEEE
ncbi:MAG: hypothetical protein IKU94_03530 [Bacteroidaceae bacterium]|nr:hypothetical protein [Bacteroidaceae bacterium]